MKNKSFTIKIKTNSGNYIPLYPKTSKHQVIGWEIGEFFGPYGFFLKTDKWQKNSEGKWEQIFNLSGITDEDLVECSLREPNILKNRVAYACLSSPYGIESLNNALKFISDRRPMTDIIVDVYWSR